MIYKFGPFSLRTDDRILTREGSAVRVTPKAVDLLLVLIEAQSRVISKSDLLKMVWPDAFVTDSSLTYHIHLLRDALADDAGKPTYIENIPRRGYRFIAPVSSIPSEPVLPTLPEASLAAGDCNQAPLDPVASAPTPPSHEEPPHPDQVRASNWSRWIGVVMTVTTLIAVVIAASALTEPPLPHVAAITRLTKDARVSEGQMVTDGKVLAFSTFDGERRLRLDGSRPELLDVLSGFRLLDVSMKHREALVTRPADHGAENGLWAVSLDTFAARRLGMIVVTTAAWSRDGTRIAYTYDRDVFVTDRNGERVRKLTTFSGEPGCLQWAPDDRSIRMTVNTPADRRSLSTLWDLDVATSSTSHVFETPTYAEDCGAWMANGRDYVFSGGPEADKQIWVARAGRGIFAGRNTRRVRLTNGPNQYTQPRPSLDGRRIFAIGVTPPTLMRYDLESGLMSPYLGGINALNVEFSRDGKSVIYVTHPDLALWRAAADGRGARRLSPNDLQVDSAAASPDGQWVAFRGRKTGTRTKIYLVPADGGAAEPLVPEDIEQGTPSWSPDGSKLAYGDVPETYSKATGSEAIHIYDRSTGEFTTLPGSKLLWSSRWSPNGKYIAALTIDRQGLRLYEVATRLWKRLEVENVGAMAWSPDSRFIYCDPERTEFWARRVQVADGSVRKLVNVHDLQSGHGAGLSLDGAPLFRIVSPDIYALELRYE